MFILRVFVVFLLIFLVEFYFTKKFVKSLKSVFQNISSSFLKKILIIFFIFINIYPFYLLVVYAYSTLSHAKNFLYPDNSFIDYFMIYPFWISIFIFVQCGLFFLIFDVIRLLFLPIYKKYKSKLRSLELKLIFALSVFFAVYVPARIIYDYYSVSIRTVEYVKKNLPPQLEGFKIVFISDVQADRYTDADRLGNYISKVNALKPDLVLMGGDVITSTPFFIDEAAKYIGSIKSKYGIYSCVGDHDNWAYRNNYARSLNEVESALDKHNVEMLDDTQKDININGAEIGVTFITNTYVEHINNEQLDSLTKYAGNFDLKILLTHQPRQKIVTKAVDYNYDLMLAGHTHGGQVTFLFPFINLTPTLIETKYVKGSFSFGRTLLIVTRGLGMSLVPMRYNSTPEITVIRLSSK